ncbi:MAG: hypothetical protein ACTH6Z_06820 [Psychrobacter sp.]
MKYLLHSLRGIARHSNDVEFLALGFKGKYHINSQKDLRFLLDQNYVKDIQLKFDFKALPMDEDFVIGEYYTYKLTVKIPETKSNFFSDSSYLLEYILNADSVIDWKNKIILPFDENFHPKQAMYKNYFKYLNRLISLYKKSTYYDSKRFVLFFDKYLSVPLFLPEKPFEVFKVLFDKVPEEVFIDSILYLESFLNEETIENHRKEKQKIFLMESYKILEHCSQDNRFYKLIENIEKIKNSVDNSFKIYLDNFSYQRLELELKKDLDYFVKSINDTIGALQTQALGLPIAAALIQMSKLNVKIEPDNTLYIPYIALIVFSLFVCFNVYQQSIQLAYIKESINRFFLKDTVSAVFHTDIPLKSMRNIIDKRILMTNIYIVSILALAVTVVLYSLKELGFLS